MTSAAATAASTVHGYELLRKLGERPGTFVFEARDSRTGRLVRLELLAPELLADEGSRERFAAAAAALMRLVHPNVIGVVDYSGALDDARFVVTEAIEAQTLAEVIEARGKLSPTVAAAVFAQVARGLAAAHGEGLLHRDLSPHNILIESSGRVVVGDFGLLASVVGERTAITFASKTALGTPLGLPPEVLRSSQYSPASDVYALGVAMTHALLGHAPGPVNDLRALLPAIMGGTLEKAQGKVNDGLAKIVDAASAADVTARTPDAMTVAAALDAHVGAVDAQDVVQHFLDPSASGDTRRQSALPPRDALDAFTRATGGRYTMKALLGEGGMGRVFAAHDRKLARDVAVKVITGEIDVAMRRRFHREARSMGRLRHPNIVEVLDYSGPDSPQPYLVLEFVDGPPLSSVMHIAAMPETAALAVVLALAEALAAVHEQGFVHRDVKPENVFVDSAGRVLLADFGIVRAVDDARSKTFAQIGGAGGGGTSSIGSPYYASPEQLFDPQNAGPRSDLFSVGSFLHALITGKLPIESKSVPDTLMKLDRGHFAPLPPNCSPDVAQLIGHLREKRPADRPASAREVVDSVKSMLVTRRVLDGRDAIRKFLGLSEDTDVPDSDKTFVRARTLTESTRLAKTAPGGATTFAKAHRRSELGRNVAVVLGSLVAAVLVLLALGFVAIRYFNEQQQKALHSAAAERALREKAAQVVVVEPPPPRELELPTPPPAVPAIEVPAAPEVKTKPTATKKIESVPATLRIVTKPWAKVTIGGKAYGETPEFNTARLEPGTYKVRFENPAFKPAERLVTLKSGDAQELRVVLER